jgi:hypothetical protein
MHLSQQQITWLRPEERDRQIDQALAEAQWVGWGRTKPTH